MNCISMYFSESLHVKEEKKNEDKYFSFNIFCLIDFRLSFSRTVIVTFGVLVSGA